MDSPLSNRTRTRGPQTHTPDRSSVLASSPATALNAQDAGSSERPDSGPAEKLKALARAAPVTETRQAVVHNSKRPRAALESPIDSPTVERDVRRRKTSLHSLVASAQATSLPTPPRSDPLSDARDPESLGPPSVPSSSSAPKRSRDWYRIPSSPTPVARSAFRKPLPLPLPRPAPPPLSLPLPPRTPSRRRTPSPPRTPSLVPYSLDELDKLRRAPGPNPFASASTFASDKSARFVTPAPRNIESTPLRSTRDSTYEPASPPSPTLQARKKRRRGATVSQSASDDDGA